jgi:hypothetical protein
MLLTEFRSHVQEFYPSFVDQCIKNVVRFEDKGILNLEALYIWTLVGHFRPEIVVESGVCRGRSTEVIARAQQFFDIPRHLAFEKDKKHAQYVRGKLKPYRTVYKILPSSTHALGPLLKTEKNTRIVFFVDGPKQGKEYQAFFKTASAFTNCLAICSHDCWPGCPTAEAFKIATARYFSDRDVFNTGDLGLAEVYPDINDVLREDMLKRWGEAKSLQNAARTHCLGVCS